MLSTRRDPAVPSIPTATRSASGAATGIAEGFYRRDTAVDYFDRELCRDASGGAITFIGSLISAGGALAATRIALPATSERVLVPRPRVAAQRRALGRQPVVERRRRVGRACGR